MKFRYFAVIGLLSIFIAGSSQAMTLWKNDWKNWRDQASNPGFDATLQIDEQKGIGTAKTDADTSYGKIMSPEAGINILLNENTTLIVELLEDIPEGDIKVDLMTAAEPYDAHTVIGPVDKKGTYKVKITEKAPWTGNHGFWISIWLEGFDRTAKIGKIQITDGKNTKPPRTTGSKTPKK
jgi:hypothetical protein